MGSVVGHAYWGLVGRNEAFKIDVAHEALSVTDGRPSLSDFHGADTMSGGVSDVMLSWVSYLQYAGVEVRRCVFLNMLMVSFLRGCQYLGLSGCSLIPTSVLLLVGPSVGQSADGGVCFELRCVRCWEVGVESGVFFDTSIMRLDGVDGVGGSSLSSGVGED